MAFPDREKPPLTVSPSTLPQRAKGRPTKARMEIERRESQRLLSLGFDAMGTNIPQHLFDQIAQDAVMEIDPEELANLPKHHRSTPRSRARSDSRQESVAAAPPPNSTSNYDAYDGQDGARDAGFQDYHSFITDSDPNPHAHPSTFASASTSASTSTSTSILPSIIPLPFTPGGSRSRRRNAQMNQPDGSVKQEDQDAGTDRPDGTQADNGATPKTGRRVRLAKSQSQKPIIKNYDIDLAPKTGSVPIFKVYAMSLSRSSFAPHQRSTFKPSWPEQAGVNFLSKPISKRAQKDRLYQYIIEAQAQEKIKIDEEKAQEKEDESNQKEEEKGEEDDGDDDDNEGGGSKDKKRKKKAKPINIVPDEADRGFMLTPHDPVIAKKLYSTILNKVKEFKNEDGKRLSEDWEELPDPEKDEEFYERFERPTSLNAITSRVEGNEYPTAADFQLDMDQLFTNARQSLPLGSLEYGDMLILQRYYQQLCTADLILHQNDVEEAIQAALAPCDPSRGYASMTLGPAHAPPGVEMENLANRVTSNRKITYNEYYYRGILLRPGDWCHVSNPSDPHLPIIGHIFKISRKDDDPAGQVWLSVCWYFRPEQTIHPPSTTFFRDEIFKTNRVGEHHVEDLVELAYAMFYTKFVKGRPVEEWWNVDKPTYIVEHRWNEDTKQFSKIKNWNSCVPEELRNKEIPLNNFATQLPIPERVPSPFLQGIEGPGHLSSEPHPSQRIADPEQIRRYNEQAAAFKRAQQEALVSGSGASPGFVSSIALMIPGRVNTGIIGSAALTASSIADPDISNRIAESPAASGSPAPNLPNPNLGKPGNQQTPMMNNLNSQNQGGSNLGSQFPKKKTFTAINQDWKKISASSHSSLSMLSNEVLKIVGMKNFLALKAYFEVPRSISNDATLEEIVDAIRSGNPNENPIITRTTFAGGIVSNPPPRNDGPVIDINLLAKWREALLKQNGFHPIPDLVGQPHLEKSFLESKRKLQEEEREKNGIKKVCLRTEAEGAIKVLPQETASLFQRDPSTSQVKWFPALPLNGPYQQKLSKTYPNSASYLPPPVGPSCSHSLEYLYQRAIEERQSRDAEDHRMDVDL